jgi:LytS/YehU family sensor histidine kinase
MRYVLAAGRHASAEVPLEEEVAFVHDYLALERLRLGERLRVEEDIEPDALELAVPPLLLQPLVEMPCATALRRAEAAARYAWQRTSSEQSWPSRWPTTAAGRTRSWRKSEGLGLPAAQRQLNARFPGRGEFEVVTAGCRIHRTHHHAGTHPARVHT